MKTVKKVRGILLLAFAAGLLLGLAAHPTPRVSNSAETADGLELTIHLVQAEGAPPNVPKFRVELRNAGETDLILNCGVMLANGKKQYPNDVVLTLTDAQGKAREFDLKEPGFVAGRLDPLIVPLPTGATFSLPIDFEKYWAAKSQEFDYKIQPGTYFLEAQYTGKGVSQLQANLDMKGVALMPYWTGTATSNRLQFEVGKQSR